MVKKKKIQKNEKTPPPPTSLVKKAREKKFRYNFLYAVTVSGEDRLIKNTLHRAVAILSNSKRLFFGHINVMLRCLDPCLAELSYIDTDSCLFSTTHENLLDCISPPKLAFFKASGVLADEEAENSCHGKMKLEGTFAAGRFKALKIYRLFNSSADSGAGPPALSDLNLELESLAEKKLNRFERLAAVYTRCKGVNRYLTTKLPDSAFDSSELDRVVVHRTALRPVRTGEMVIAHEARTLSVPFNLKRWTTDDGYHTFPLSFVSEAKNETIDKVVDAGDEGSSGSGRRKRGRPFASACKKLL